MSIQRRRLVVAAACSPALACIGAARAQSAAARTVRILCGFAAGGTGDTLARMLAEKLAAAWGQPVIVENRTGASGTIALEALARSAADGLTLGMLNIAQVVAGELIKLPYRVETDFTPLAGIAQQANILVVNPSLPPANVKELVQYLKARPRQISFASGGNGTPGHVAGELFMQQTGVEIVHVPYKGGPPALQDVMAGHVGMMFAPGPPALPLIRSGKLRALAVTSQTRATFLQDLPALSESGVDLDVRDWHGIVGPAGLAAEVTSRISRDVLAVLASPEIQQRMATLMLESLPGSSAEFGSMIARETLKWRSVVRQGKLTAS